VADPRPEMLGDSVRLSIAGPSGSLAMLEGGEEDLWRGARCMLFVRNERPTWYAAVDAICMRSRRGKREERGVPFIQPNPS
jgi:hypothetical protein